MFCIHHPVRPRRLPKTLRGLLFPYEFFITDCSRIVEVALNIRVRLPEIRNLQARDDAHTLPCTLARAVSDLFLRKKVEAGRRLLPVASKASLCPQLKLVTWKIWTPELVSTPFR